MRARIWRYTQDPFWYLSKAPVLTYHTGLTGIPDRSLIKFTLAVKTRTRIDTFGIPLPKAMGVVAVVSWFALCRAAKTNFHLDHEFVRFS